MSFKLGRFDTRHIHGMSAILDRLPSLPVAASLEDLPAGDGSVYYGSRMQATEWDFNLSLRGRNVYEVLKLTEDVARHLNPSVHGLQDFTPRAFEPWVWQGVVSSEIQWDRDKILWFGEGICQLNGSVTITTPDPYGKRVLPAQELSGAGVVALTDVGNAPYYPLVVIQGMSSDSSYIRVSNHQGSCDLYAELTTKEELVLDFENLSFFVRDKDTKKFLRSVADRFLEFTRFKIIGDSELSVSSGAATLSKVVVTATCRRI